MEQYMEISKEKFNEIRAKFITLMQIRQNVNLNIHQYKLDNLPLSTMLQRYMKEIKYPFESIPPNFKLGPNINPYEKCALLMIESGFPIEPLKDRGKYIKFKFTGVSEIFRQNSIILNEQNISSFARRLLCPFDVGYCDVWGAEVSTKTLITHIR